MDPARQFFSSYLGMGNNPVIGVDPDGEKVIPITTESSVAAGDAYGAGANYSFGYAFDDYGVTYFKYKSGYLTNPGKTGEFLMGGDVELLDQNFGYSDASTFSEYIEQMPAKISVGPIDITLGDGVFGLGASFGWVGATKELE